MIPRVASKGFKGGRMVWKGRWRLEGGVKMSEAHQGWLGKKMMVGFVQDARGKIMRKMQKLGQNCEGLWMTVETYEKLDFDAFFIDVSRV